VSLGRFGCLVSTIIALTVAPEIIFAQENIKFGLSADYYGKYIWRGQDLDDDPVFQPGITASYGGLTAGIWGSLETTNYTDNAGDFTEVDYSLDYSADIPGIEGVGFSVGVIYYDFPNTEFSDTTELYWGLNFDLPLIPSITVYHDVDEADGTYASFAIGHSFEKICELAPDTPAGMEIAASFGWGNSNYNNYYWGVDSCKANDLTMSVAFPFAINGWTISPSLNYVTLLDSAIRNSDAYRTESDYFFFGIGVSTEF